MKKASTSEYHAPFDLRQCCGKMAFPPPRVEKDYFKQTHKMCVTSEASELYI